jgi:hypothetical protein
MAAFLVLVAIDALPAGDAAACSSITTTGIPASDSIELLRA